MADDVPEALAALRRRIAKQVGGAVEETYEKRAPTKNPFKKALRQLNRGALERATPGMVRPGHSYYLHTVRTGTPAESAKIAKSIDDHGLFYRHYAAGKSQRVRPFLLGPLGEDPETYARGSNRQRMLDRLAEEQGRVRKGAPPSGTALGRGNEYMTRVAPSTRTYIIELPDNIAHIDQVGELVPPGHPLYETISDARELRAPGADKSLRWTARLSPDYIVGHVEEGKLHLKPPAAAAVKEAGGGAQALKTAGRGIQAAANIAMAADLGLQLGKHGPSGIMDFGAHFLDAAVLAELPQMGIDAAKQRLLPEELHDVSLPGEVVTQGLAGAGRAIRGTMDPLRSYRATQERAGEFEQVVEAYRNAGLSEEDAREQAYADTAAGGVAPAQSAEIAEKLHWTPEKGRRQVLGDSRPPTDPRKLAQWAAKRAVADREQREWEEAHPGLDDIDLGLGPEEQPPPTSQGERLRVARAALAPVRKFPVPPDGFTEEQGGYLKTMQEPVDRMGPKTNPRREEREEQLKALLRKLAKQKRDET